jgi:hypothetical protein
MKALLEPIKEIARFDELFRDLKKGTAGVTVISGCLESQKAHMIAGLSEDAPVRLLIAENELKAKSLFKDEAMQNSYSAMANSKFIRDLKNALIRIENKTYGICKVTGKLINKERLKLVPHATMSIEAKNMQK